jgi:ABC-2 type transport system permease protein
MQIERQMMQTHPSDVLPSTGEAKPGVRVFAAAIGNEITKGLIDLWRGKIASLLELILFALFFLAILFALGREAFHREQVAPLLLGFVGYLFFHMQTNRLFWGLLGEMQSGTLEQMYLSPLPSWLLTVGLQAASVVEATLSALVLYLLINLGVPVSFPLQWAALLPLVLLVVSSVGYSLILGGLTLLFKRLEILKEMFQIIVLIFGGVFVSLDRMPAWMATIARFLPLTPGVEVLRKTLLDGVSLGTLLWLGGNAAAYLLLGIVAFRWCERMAKRRHTGSVLMTGEVPVHGTITSEDEGESCSRTPRSMMLDIYDRSKWAKKGGKRSLELFSS